MINKLLWHIMTICKHKFYVGIYMFKSGFYFRGIMHDMSKFSPTEFSESIKYYYLNKILLQISILCLLL